MGFGKRTPASEYRLTHRGGKGVITMNVTEKTGKVISVRQVGSDDQVVLITDHGKVIRLGVKHVRITGRNAQGVHLVRWSPARTFAPSRGWPSPNPKTTVPMDPANLRIAMAPVNSG